MKKTLLTAGALLGFSGLASAQLVFNTDFGAASDGGMTEAAGWEGQAAWTISSGNATNAANYSRARNLTQFKVAVGETVVVNITDLVFTGAGNGGNSLYSFGLASELEHTGAQMPQVAAELSFTGSSLSIGGVTDTAYAAGSDIVDIELQFTRLATGSGWDLVASINNKTDGTNFNGTTIASTNIAGQTGDNAGLTLSQFLDADTTNNDARFGMRGTTGAATDAAIAIGGVSVSVIPEPGSFAMIAGLFGLGLVTVRRKR